MVGRLLTWLGRLDGGVEYAVYGRRVRRAIVKRLAIASGLDEDVLERMVRGGGTVELLRGREELISFLRGELPRRGRREAHLLHIIDLAEEL